MPTTLMNSLRGKSPWKDVIGQSWGKRRASIPGKFECWTIAAEESAERQRWNHSQTSLHGRRFRPPGSGLIEPVWTDCENIFRKNRLRMNELRDFLKKYRLRMS